MRQKAADFSGGEAERVAWLVQITGVQDVTDLRSHRAPVHGLNDFGIGERKQQVLHIGGTFAAARHMNDQRMHGLHLPQKGALEKRSGH